MDISVNCRATNESCRLTEIASGQNMSGALIFTIRKSDSGLVFYYPRTFGFGSTMEFLLGP